MNAYFIVCIEQVEEDADLDIIKEKIEIVLAKELPFNDATVEIETA